MKSQWINHKGLQIFLIDLNGLTNHEIVLEMQEVERYLSQLPSRVVPALTDVRNIVVNQETLKIFKEHAPIMGEKLGHTAVVGIYGIRTYFLDIVNAISSLNTKPFNTPEQAKDWLFATIRSKGTGAGDPK